MQELSGFWRATAPDAVIILGDFSPKRISPKTPRTLHHLKPGEATGPDSVCPELVIHAGPGLKFWPRGFLSFCLCQFKISKVWKRALVVAIPRLSKPVEIPTHLSALRRLQDRRTTDLQTRQTNSRPLAPKGTGWISSRKVYHRSGCFAHTKH